MIEVRIHFPSTYNIYYLTISIIPGLKKNSDISDEVTLVINDICYLDQQIVLICALPFISTYNLFLLSISIHHRQGINVPPTVPPPTALPPTPPSLFSRSVSKV